MLLDRKKRQQVQSDNEDIKGKSDVPGVVVPLIVGATVTSCQICVDENNWIACENTVNFENGRAPCKSLKYR